VQIKEVMTPNVKCTEPTATLRHAAQRMRDLDVGLLPVCENDRLAGMITDRDITVRAVAAGLDPVEARVRDIMTPKVIYCLEDDDVSEAARLMRENQVRRIVVLNDQKRLTGILSLGDLAVDVGDDMLAGHTLEAVSEPAEPRR
jgi:CBS domain-containing protein